MAVLVDVLLLFMLINTSSIFEFNMLVAVAIMFTILELIMEIMPNNPTALYHILKLCDEDYSFIWRSSSR